jgi:hypothetical protein
MIARSTEMNLIGPTPFERERDITLFSGVQVAVTMRNAVSWVVTPCRWNTD